MALEKLLDHEVGVEARARFILDLCLSDIEDSCNVGMAQGRRCSRLLLETRQPLSILRETLGQNLDGHFASEPRVLRQIHLAHAARAERLEDRVGTESFADHAHEQ